MYVCKGCPVYSEKHKSKYETKLMYFKVLIWKKKVFKIITYLKIKNRKQILNTINLLYENTYT